MSRVKGVFWSTLEYSASMDSLYWGAQNLSGVLSRPLPPNAAITLSVDVTSTKADISMPSSLYRVAH